MTIVLADEVALVALVFARIGGAVMLLPLFGESYVLARARLTLALALSLLLAPIVAPLMAPVGSIDGSYGFRIVVEVVHGLFIGALVRLAVAALSIAGTMVAMQMGLAAANFFNPGEAQQGSVSSNLFTMTGFAALLAVDGHHALLQGLAASYLTLPAGELQAAGMAEAFSRASADAVTLGTRMAMPITAAAIVLQVLLGIMNRLVPSLQVIFVALPAQILLGLGILGLSVAGVAHLFLAFVGELTAWLGA